MNVREFILRTGTGTDVGVLADKYLEEALALADPDEQRAALAPAVRSLVSTIASSLRKAQRGSVQSPDASQRTDGVTVLPQPPVTVPDEGVQTPDASQPSSGAPARDRWLDWLTDNSQATLWIPGTGKKLIADVTADEFDRRADWLANAARGMNAAADEARACATALRTAGASCIGELAA